MEEGEFVKITDRKKEIFKTSGGKYIAPQPMENIYKQSPFIEQVMVIGENQKHSSALIVPSFQHLRSHFVKLKERLGSNEEIIQMDAVKTIIQEEIDKYNKNFGNWEQIKKPKLIPSEFTIAGGELTPTLKLKRKVILAKYAQEIEEIYN